MVSAFVFTLRVVLLLTRLCLLSVNGKVYIFQLDVTCFIIIILFTAQHVSNVSTSILKILRLLWIYFMRCIVL